MKKVILLLVVVFTFTSCGFVKWISEEYKSENTNTQTDVKTDDKEKEEVKISDKSTFKTDSTNIKSLQLIEKLTAEWESRLKTYDTTKPVDPTTGTPPLASELTITNKNISDKNLTENIKISSSLLQENDIEVDYKKEMRRFMDSTMAENRKLITNYETKTTKGVKWFWWVLFGSVVTVLIYCAVRFNWLKKLSFIARIFR